MTIQLSPSQRSRLDRALRQHERERVREPDRVRVIEHQHVAAAASGPEVRVDKNNRSVASWLAQWSK